MDELLAAREKLGSFLAMPHAVSGGTQAYESAGEGPGSTIGPYKVLQQIGEGGMGAVYMAEQEQPVRRKVALKIVKSGLDSAQVIARFEAERQALAMMDHPNIAKVLDAGTTESGRPYFIMELVKGIPITRFCDEHQLTPRQRLELFIPVCQAVQHAHQKGIIHRDLKPSNVLVALYDDQPVPKVIDFGVAKATSQKLTERTLFTAFGSLVGTLEYMSPEQAKLNALDIDTRSDVYALGVLLYELLTGNTPLEHERLKQTALDELLRIIREEEPPKPSTRLSHSGESLAAISAQRGIEPAKLGQVLRGELDWIIMKALEKERMRRYETANALARDIAHYLADEPVEACPPTTGYRLRKFVRKHKVGLATAVGFAALLVFGTAVSAWQAVRATQAEAVAQANEHRANAHAGQAEQKEQEAKTERDEAKRQRDEVRALNEKLQATQAHLRSTLYAAHMSLAQHAWEGDDIGRDTARVVELLEQQRPKRSEDDLRGFEWHYLNRLCHSELLTLKGHTAWVGSVAYSPDSKRLASISRDKTAKVWDAETGQEFLTLKGQTGGFGSVVFSPDGKRLASASGDQTVKVWDAQTGQQLLWLKGAGGGMAFSPDSKRLACGSDKNTVKVWDGHTGQELFTCKGHTNQVKGVVYSPDGNRLASGSGGYDQQDKPVPGEVKVWDARTGHELFTLQARTGGYIDSVAFSPDGKRLACVSGFLGTVKVCDAQTGQELLSLKGADGNVAFNPDGKRLASGSKVWDAYTGQELLSLKGADGLVFSPDGKRLASATGHVAKVWDAQTGEVLFNFKGHIMLVTSVIFSPDGHRLVSTSADTTVKVWDVHKDHQDLTLRPHGSVPGAELIAFSPDGACVAIASSKETVQVWDVHTGKHTLTLNGHTVPLTGVVFSPDGKRLASCGGGHRTPSGNWEESRQDRVDLKVWDAQTGQELLTFELPKGSSIWSMVYSPDGKRLACAAGDVVKVWDARTGQELCTLKGHAAYVSSVAFNPDGKRLSSAAVDGTVKVWDPYTGEELKTRKAHTGLPGDVMHVAYSPDGKRLASAWSGELGSEVKVWDVQTDRELLYLKCVPDRVAFSPDGKRLVSAGKVWDAQSGEEICPLGVLCLSPDGKHFAKGAPDGAVTICDATPLPERP
jgi:WD40 repeat protein/serine/threonine protein kinase